ncbi:MAG: hypothetical protein ACI8R4_003881 [Paracoccaceae bacterium]
MAPGCPVCDHPFVRFSTPQEIFTRLPIRALLMPQIARRFRVAGAKIAKSVSRQGCAQDRHRHRKMPGGNQGDCQMRLVTFTSAIAFGLVAGLSQAGDWNGVQVALFDRSAAFTVQQTPLAAPKAWRVSQRSKSEITTLAPSAPLADPGMTLAITDPVGFWGWGLETTPINRLSANDPALRPQFQNAIGPTLAAQTGNFLMNVSFRF